MRVQFICKIGECYGFNTYNRRSCGLYNSVSFIVQALAARGVHTQIDEVIDNNDIDRAVTAFKPDLVIIEALWVVPEKFDILKKLHPHVKWFAHLHSNMPFLALEGIAMDWIFEYVSRGVGIIANSFESNEALDTILDEDQLTFLPNVYLSQSRAPDFGSECRGHINIGCFGAVRPLKNHLLQAMAAIQFARDQGKFLYFYINASRVETGGQPVLKNLIRLFEGQDDAELVFVDWLDRELFLENVRLMDIGMQVSLSETFNVVSADYVSEGIPMVVSKEVHWASRWNKADDGSLDDIVRIMHRVYKSKFLVYLNQYLLEQYSRQAQRMWYKFARK